MDNKPKKILVVEDDADLRNILIDGLKPLNYQIVPAEDGEQAMELLLDQKPDLVLLDLLLPKLDGFKVLERLRQYPDKVIAETKVIVLSNLWSDKDILRAQALKVDEYYVKANTNLEDVFKKVKAVLSAPPAAK
jgi:two-component system, OmpR family, alkaline phosphatase synthesis response regulator PhoP